MQNSLISTLLYYLAFYIFSRWMLIMPSFLSIFLLSLSLSLSLSISIYLSIYIHTYIYIYTYLSIYLSISILLFWISIFRLKRLTRTPGMYPCTFTRFCFAPTETIVKYLLHSDLLCLIPQFRYTLYKIVKC